MYVLYASGADKLHFHVSNKNVVKVATCKWIYAKNKF